MNRMETGWSTERKQDGKKDGNRIVHREETAKKQENVIYREETG